MTTLEASLRPLLKKNFNDIEEGELCELIKRVDEAEKDASGFMLKDETFEALAQHFCSKRYEPESRRWTGLLILILLHNSDLAQQQLVKLPLPVKAAIGKNLASGHELIKRLAASTIRNASLLGVPVEDFGSDVSSPLVKVLMQHASRPTNSQWATQLENTLSLAELDEEMRTDAYHLIGIVIDSTNYHNEKSVMLICDLDVDNKMLHVFQFPFAATPLFLDINLADMSKVEFQVDNIKDSKAEIGRLVLYFGRRMENYTHNGARASAEVVELCFGPASNESESLAASDLWEAPKSLMEDIKNSRPRASNQQSSAKEEFIIMSQKRVGKRLEVQETQEHPRSDHSSQRTSRSQEYIRTVTGESSPARPSEHQSAVINAIAKPITETVNTTGRYSKVTKQTPKTNARPTAATSGTKSVSMKSADVVDEEEPINEDTPPPRSAKGSASLASAPKGMMSASSKPLPKAVVHDNESTSDEVPSVLPLPEAQPARPKKKRDQLRDSDGQLPVASTSAPPTSAKGEATELTRVSPDKKNLKTYKSPRKVAESSTNKVSKAKALTEHTSIDHDDAGDNDLDEDADNDADNVSETTTEAFKKKTLAKSANLPKVNSKLASMSSRQASTKKKPTDNDEELAKPNRSAVKADIYTFPPSDEDDIVQAKPAPQKKTTKTKSAVASKTAKSSKTVKKPSAKTSKKEEEQPRRRSTRNSSSAGKKQAQYKDNTSSNEEEDEEEGEDLAEQTTAKKPLSRARAVPKPAKSTRRSGARVEQPVDEDEFMQDAEDEEKSVETAMQDKEPPQNKSRRKTSAPPKHVPQPAAPQTFDRRVTPKQRTEPRAATKAVVQEELEALGTDPNKPSVIHFGRDGPGNQGMTSVSHVKNSKESVTRRHAAYNEDGEELDADGFRVTLVDVQAHDAAVNGRNTVDAAGHNVTNNTSGAGVTSNIGTALSADHANRPLTDMPGNVQVAVSPSREDAPVGSAAEAETEQQSFATSKIEDSIGNQVPYLSMPQYSTNSTQIQQASHYFTESAQNLIQDVINIPNASGNPEEISTKIVRAEAPHNGAVQAHIASNPHTVGTIDPRMLSLSTETTGAPFLETLHVTKHTEEEVSLGHIRVTEQEYEFERQVKRPAPDELQADHAKRTRVTEVNGEVEEESQSSPVAVGNQAEDDIEDDIEDDQDELRFAQDPHDLGKVSESHEARNSPLSRSHSEKVEEDEAVEEAHGNTELDEPRVPQVLPQSQTVTDKGSPIPRPPRTASSQPAIADQPSQYPVSKFKSAIKDDSQRSVQVERKQVKMAATHIGSFTKVQGVEDEDNEEHPRSVNTSEDHMHERAILEEAPQAVMQAPVRQDQCFPVARPESLSKVQPVQGLAAQSGDVQPSNVQAGTAHNSTSVLPNTKSTQRSTKASSSHTQFVADSQIRGRSLLPTSDVSVPQSGIQLNKATSQNQTSRAEVMPQQPAHQHARPVIIDAVQRIFKKPESTFAPPRSAVSDNVPPVQANKKNLQQLSKTAHDFMAPPSRQLAAMNDNNVPVSRSISMAAPPMNDPARIVNQIAPSSHLYEHPAIDPTSPISGPQIAKQALPVPTKSKVNSQAAVVATAKTSNQPAKSQAQLQPSMLVPRDEDDVFRPSSTQALPAKARSHTEASSTLQAQNAAAERQSRQSDGHQMQQDKIVLTRAPKKSPADNARAPNIAANRKTSKSVQTMKDISAQRSTSRPVITPAVEQQPEAPKPLSRFQQSLRQSMLPVVGTAIKSPLHAKQIGTIDWDNNDESLNDAGNEQDVHESSQSRGPDAHLSQEGYGSEPMSIETGNYDDERVGSDEDEDMEYSTHSEDDSDDDPTTLIDDTTLSSAMPSHERDLLDALTAITAGYSSHVIAQSKGTVDLLMAYERGGLKLVTQFGDCRQEEVALAEQEMDNMKKETGVYLQRMLHELKEEGEQVKELNKELDVVDAGLQEMKKRQSGGLNALFALC